MNRDPKKAFVPGVYMFRSLIAVLLATAVGAGAIAQASAADLIGFWDKPEYGANSFNARPPDRDYFEALRATGASWVRLTFSKWRGEGRDFLIGDADDYRGLPASDLATLHKVLADADASGLKVVVVPLSLPGARWSQQNNGTFDDRLWSDPAFGKQAVAFWTDLAKALKDEPAVAAYNLLNEPAPERKADLVENASMADNLAWQKAQAGSTRNLPALYNRIIEAIRTVDPVTPVMVDGGYFANPRSLASWPDRLDDDRVLYAFHMYEPYEATSAPNVKRDVPLRYPGVRTAYDGGETEWDRDIVAAHIGAAFDWARARDIPASRVVAGEFGCMRRWQDCGAYLSDVMDAVDQRGGHWAFYAFREDEWDGMDYELPQDLPPGRFYWLSEQGQADKLPRNGPLMQMIEARMKD